MPLPLSKSRLARQDPLAPEPIDLVIMVNKAKCLACGDTLISMHRHDYVTCSCGSLSVDGGREYLKRNFVSDSDWQERSVHGEPTAPGKHQLENSATVILGVHSPDVCLGKYCTLHKLSGHSMRSYEQLWADGQMWRVCPRGVRHPDPDDYIIVQHPERTHHECCPERCCAGSYIRLQVASPQVAD
jgi:hypothetical protein